MNNNDTTKTVKKDVVPSLKIKLLTELKKMVLLKLPKI